MKYNNYYPKLISHHLLWTGVDCSNLLIVRVIYHITIRENRTKKKKSPNLEFLVIEDFGLLDLM